ncbi:AAA family ATPase [Sinomonas notoginsengisoli]|uniref:AAA family ATPase n=1 Tax=Sinomonas notoginsengisoli TaxID=1457311 RepID=UPI001F390BA3|nr:AAA family ATPase [Sinomonas notoginsengisoli]
MTSEERPVVDPRISLSTWANKQSEWVRSIVRQVIATGRPLTQDDIDGVYDLFRQEKGLDRRELPSEPPLSVEASAESAEAPLVITRLSDIHGVNALVSGSVIEPHDGLTILYGENGTGKTGYSRIFKALAGSRTADHILSNVNTATPEAQSALLSYRVGAIDATFTWKGEIGKAPFTRMSIFDSPSVNFHVDADLEYVYRPSALALFDHISAGIRGVQSKISDSTRELSSGSASLLSRFARDSSIYPQIETLGASTDLPALEARADSAPDTDERIDNARRAVAALEANTIASEITTRQRLERALEQAEAAATKLSVFDGGAYDAALAQLVELRSDLATFRGELFQAANLPAEPDDTWSAFVASGDAYRQHLIDLGVHNHEVCLYCRQTLSAAAAELLGKYREFLEDKISADIRVVSARIERDKSALVVATNDLESLVADYAEEADTLPILVDLRSVADVAAVARDVSKAGTSVGNQLDVADDELIARLHAARVKIQGEITQLREQAKDREKALIEKRIELRELVAAIELAQSLPEIRVQVGRAKESDQLTTLAKPLAGLLRALTDQAKAASDELINQNFDMLFDEECRALRAPALKLEFVGRQGKAQRRKTIVKHKPSRVLSEGEQKVLAMADFLAEARLAGITAPVLFDDPVSSLDHRRINEVAQRIVNLSTSNQVIVFTHDILFATTLLALSESTGRCSYLHITDDEGKGQVTRASGPRWDTLKNLTSNINKTIQAAKAATGEARAALVREGFDWIRSWCEVFTEVELLQGVSQRYQPNIRMTVLPKIKAGALPDAISVVTRVFDDACRYIPGHSQPLATLGVAPTLPELEARWQELQEARKQYLAA